MKEKALDIVGELWYNVLVTLEANLKTKKRCKINLRKIKLASNINTDVGC